MAVDFSDSFTRANSGSLGGSWTNLGASPTIVSNQCAMPSSAAVSYWNGGTPAADCYVKATSVTSVGSPSFNGLIVRLNTTSFNWYSAEWNDSVCSIWRYDGGAGTALGTTGFTAPANGDVVELRIVGSTITLYYNGTLQETRTDSTYSASGRAGVTGAGTSNRLDSFETGTPITNIDGVLSKTLANVTASAAGTIDLAGVLAKTLAAATLTATSTLDITGTSSPTLADATLAATSTIADIPIDGVLSQTLADATATATGTLDLFGVLSSTLADVSASGAASLDVAGDLTATLGDVTLSAAGESAYSGVLSVTLDDATTAATGAVDIVAALTATLDDATLVATGESLVSGDGAVSATLDDATLVSAGTVDLAGVLSSTLANATASAAGSLDLAGTLTKTLGNVLSSGAAGLDVAGALSQTLGDAVLASTGEVLIQGTLTKALADATLVADALLDAGITGLADVTLDDVTATAAGTLPIVGLLGVTLGDATLDAQGIDPDAVPATTGGGGAGKVATTAQWLKLDKQLNHEAAERAERLRPARPSRVARTKARVVEQAAQIEAVDESAAVKLRELWNRWYQAELRVAQTPPDEAYSQFATDLAAYMADQQMEAEIEEMLILMAVVALV